jgi:hypothetical protein
MNSRGRHDFRREPRRHTLSLVRIAVCAVLAYAAFDKDVAAQPEGIILPEQVQVVGVIGADPERMVAEGILVIVIVRPVEGTLMVPDTGAVFAPARHGGVLVLFTSGPVVARASHPLWIDQEGADGGASVLIAHGATARLTIRGAMEQAGGSLDFELGAKTARRMLIVPATAESVLKERRGSSLALAIALAALTAAGVVAIVMLRRRTRADSFEDSAPRAGGDLAIVVETLQSVVVQEVLRIPDEDRARLEGLRQDLLSLRDAAEKLGSLLSEDGRSRAAKAVDATLRPMLDEVEATVTAPRQAPAELKALLTVLVRGIRGHIPHQNAQELVRRWSRESARDLALCLFDSVESEEEWGALERDPEGAEALRHLCARSGLKFVVPEAGRRIDPARHKFDPVGRPSRYPRGAIHRVLRRGYEWQGSVYRHAVVEISVGPEPEKV